MEVVYCLAMFVSATSPMVFTICRSLPFNPFLFTDYIYFFPDRVALYLHVCFLLVCADGK